MVHTVTAFIDKTPFPSDVFCARGCFLYTKCLVPVFFITDLAAPIQMIFFLLAVSHGLCKLPFLNSCVLVLVFLVVLLFDIGSVYIEARALLA